MEIRPPGMRLSRRSSGSRVTISWVVRPCPAKCERDGAEVSAHPRAQVDALARIFLLESEAGRMELSSSDGPSLQYVCDISSLDPVPASQLPSEPSRRPPHVNKALADCGQPPLHA